MSQKNTRDLRTRVSRRRLLQGVSALTASLSSPAWMSSTAFGADATAAAALRFIGIFSSNGTVPGSFWPNTKATEEALNLSPILQPLAKHKDNLLQLKGLHYHSTLYDKLGVEGAQKPGGPHMKGPAAMLTGGSLMPGVFTGAGGPAGWADRISLDQVLAKRISEGTSFPSLEFGVRIEGQEPLRVISYRDADQPNLTVDDPYTMYSRVFGNIGSGVSEAEIKRQLAEKKSLLDFIRGELNTLQGRLSSEDKAALEAHLTAIRSLEQRLTAGPATCTPPTLKSPKPNVREPKNFGDVGRMQTDVMAMAIICGLTRVATFMWANANSWQVYPWLGIEQEHHDLSHAVDSETDKIEKLVKINQWHSEQLSYLLDKLSEAKDSDGSSVLKNSLVLWGNELGNGQTHTHLNIPWIMAGQAGGAIKTGRFIDYGNRPHNDLLLSICHAFGLNDINSFGIPGVCTGPLSKLS